MGIYDLEAVGDFEGMWAMFHPEFVRVRTSGDLIVGRDANIAALEAFKQKFPKYKISCSDFVAEDDNTCTFQSVIELNNEGPEPPASTVKKAKMKQSFKDGPLIRTET